MLIQNNFENKFYKRYINVEIFKIGQKLQRAKGDDIEDKSRKKCLLLCNCLYCVYGKI